METRGVAWRGENVSRVKRPEVDRANSANKLYFVLREERSASIKVTMAGQRKRERNIRADILTQGSHNSRLRGQTQGEGCGPVAPSQWEEPLKGDFVSPATECEQPVQIFASWQRREKSVKPDVHRYPSLWRWKARRKFLLFFFVFFFFFPFFILFLYGMLRVILPVGM